MEQSQYQSGIDPTTADEIVSAARTGLGDTLRSIVHFTPAAFDVLYVRRDLSGDGDAAHEARSRLVAIERSGFAEKPLRTALGEGSLERGSVGPYRFTVRFHDDGFVVRVIEGDRGVLLTADEMDVRDFEEAAIAIRGILRE
ncbi:DUF7522 family protein [Halorubrum sp. HHNYT27]|uniref:DUF7522 family protein n=1 Tax=Halorubrum sp. HHNYT27 TaxID=3402275 RepID=UPI003EBCB75D